MVFARVAPAPARARARARARVPAIAAVVALLLAALPLGLQSQTASPEPVRTQAERSTEQVVAGLSQDAVSITTDFTGSEILIFGAVMRETAPPDGGPLGVRHRALDAGAELGVGRRRQKQREGEHGQGRAERNGKSVAHCFTSWH